MKDIYGDDVRMRSLLRFAEKELKHQELFRRQVESESRLENLKVMEKRLDEKQAALTSSLEEQSINSRSKVPTGRTTETGVPLRTGKLVRSTS